MALTQLKISWDELNRADLVKLSHNLWQNDFSRNITDYCAQVDADNEARFIRITGPETPPDGDSAMRCALYANPGNTNDVIFKGYIGGPIANAAVFHVAFKARATAAKNVTLRIVETHSGTSRANATIAVKADWRTHYVRLAASAAITSAHLAFELGADANSFELADVRVYMEEDSEQLGRIQSVQLTSKSPLSMGVAVDDRDEWAMRASRGMTRVQFVDPFVSNDPDWWSRKMWQRGREWSPGEMHLDGDGVLATTATDFWSASDSLINLTSTNVVGGNSIAVYGSTTTDALPLTYRALTIKMGQRYEGSAWVTSPTTATVLTCPLYHNDGVTTYRTSTLYTLTEGNPVLVRNAFTLKEDFAVLGTIGVGIGSSTDPIHYSGIKLEKGEYTPFAPQKTAGLWALALKLDDATGTNWIYALVPRLRFETQISPLGTGRRWIQTIAATGDELLIGVQAQ